MSSVLMELETKVVLNLAAYIQQAVQDHFRSIEGRPSGKNLETATTEMVTALDTVRLMMLASIQAVPGFTNIVKESRSLAIDLAKYLLAEQKRLADEAARTNKPVIIV